MTTPTGKLSAGLGNIYDAAIQEQLRRESDTLRLMARERRRGHLEPPSPEAVAAHAEFEARWNALVNEGFERGLLERDYDGLHMTEPEREWVWDETEEEHQARLKREGCDVGSGGHVVFTTVQRGPSR